MEYIHKDVKSPNYLIAEGNILKLADFGLAKKSAITIKNATERASLPWMAPELMTDEVLSPFYDIHAYGVVVWELWTTEIPFEGSDAPNTIWRICNDGERPVIPPDCPKALADLMRQCWDKDWHKRPTIDHILLVLTSAEREHFQQRLTTGSFMLEKVFGKGQPGKLSCAMGIEVSPTGDVAVASRAAKIQVYNAEGQHKLSIDTTQGLMPGTQSWPWNVTVSTEGNYVITDGTRFIKVYDSSGMYKDRWVAISPENKPSNTENTTLIGLTMDSKGQLLVGEVKQKYISRHRQDGSHITSIKVNIKPYFLAVTSQDTIIVSNYWNYVQIVNSTGHMLHTFKPPSHVTRWYAYGVCCYEDIIFICNNRSPSHGVHCFSSSGEYLRSIDTKDYPHCLAIGKRKLYVTYHDRVEIYSCG
ncbi:mitogen-activated protein kinase kinase kinase 7-like [Amphiura filiformis]|uniref:mitogen-activated protein kinase kinase kinase 7-like n=1 Tax=Amphiura filiformis TaxID=82378 RepID=UPI003B20FF31